MVLYLIRIKCRTILIIYKMKVIYDNLSVEEFFTVNGVIYTDDWTIDNMSGFESKLEEFGLDIYTILASENTKNYIDDTLFLFDPYKKEFLNKELHVKSTFDTFGIENVNFSLVRPSFNAWDECKRQRLERGFDDSELWSLDNTICKFILPRLRRFNKVKCGTPAGLTEEEWTKIIDNIAEAIDIYLNYNDAINSEKVLKNIYTNDIPGLPGFEYGLDSMLEKHKIYKRGVKLMYKYFYFLWD